MKTFFTDPEIELILMNSLSDIVADSLFVPDEEDVGPGESFDDLFKN